MSIFFNQPQFIQGRVYRVLIFNAAQGANNLLMAGSGFFISGDLFITCFHVAFRRELRNIRADTRFQSLTGNDEHSKLVALYNGYSQTIQIEISPGQRVNATLSSFSELYDFALLRVEIDSSSKINVCALDLQTKLSLGEKVTFGGFPTHHSYSPDQTPFALHEGMVASYLVTEIGGGTYEHYHINSINLGGNSGAPLFKLDGKKVIGIINGNLNWGRDDLAVVAQAQQPQQVSVVTASFRVPLSIAYATPLKLISENTDLLNK